MAKDTPLTRKLAAIVVADVVSYSRFMEADEVGTLRLVQQIQKACIAPIIGAYGGRLIKTTGDGFLFEFSSAVEATLFAVAFQQRLQSEMEAVPLDKRLVVRVGVHAGDILSDGADMFGDGVNVAARLETLCVPGGICMSAVVQQQLQGKLDLPLVDLGHHQVKNITRAIHAFGLDAAAIGTVASVEPARSPVVGRRRRVMALAAAAAALVVLAAGTAALVMQRPGFPFATRAAGADTFSIAVLPFTTLSADGKPDDLADALVDNLTTDLAIGLPKSSVIASASTFTYRGKAIDPPTVGRELGARYLLEGSVQRTSATLRVNVHLIEAAGATEVWTDHFERPVGDLDTMQDEITTGIANALSVQLVRAEAERPTAGGNPTALELVFRAGALMQRDDTEGFKSAETLLRQALTLAPDNMMAAQSLGSLLLVRAANQLSHQGDMGTDLDEAERLLATVRGKTPRAPGLNNLLGFDALVHDKPDDALNFYAQEIAIDPSAASAYAGQGLCLIKLGRAAEAVPLIEKSIRLDPRSPGISGNYQVLMLAYFAKGDYPKAIESGERAHAANPDSADALFYLAAARALNGDEAGARDTLAEAVKLDPNRHLEALRQGVKAAEPANIDLTNRYIAGLQKAGLAD